MPKVHDDKYRQRLAWVGVFVIVFSLLLSSKLFLLQIVRGDDYVETADRSYLQTNEQFDRGTIFLSSKEGIPIAGATIVRGYLLALDPRRIEDPEALYTTLEPYLITINKDEFIQRASKKTDPYEEIEHKIEREQADEIKALELPGVNLYQESWRYYPGEGLLSNALGFVAFRQDTLQGQYGLERQYDDLLARDSEEVNINVFAEIFSNLNKTVFQKNKDHGDIVTTIDARTQQQLEQTLAKALDEWSAKSAFGIVTNPQTGELYAMASTPSYNNNSFGSVKDISIYRNPLIENIYEFGSVIKPLVVAGALDVNAVTADTEYYDAGSVVVEDATIKNYDGKGRGQVTVRDILAESLNTGMVFIMQQMGRDALRNYLTAFGIGERTGIDLPSEVKGLVSNLQSPRELEYATASFGQGISMSPIALARALSALGNGGYLIQPHVVKEIRYEDADDEIIQYSKEDMTQVISTDSSERITRILVSIVDDTLGGGAYKKPGYTIAAKTGTAQIPNPQGGYYDDRNQHSFFGYFPAYDPQYLILLSIEHPKNAKFASQTLTDPFFEIADFLIRYYNVAPDRQ